MGESHHQVGQGALVVGALGVVYGDIGTSPLYAMREAFTEPTHVLHVDEVNVYGVGSLAFWALILIISVKYLYFVMRADNRGEGGILALTSLVMPRHQRVVKAGALVTLGVFGTALLYGDGIITPAISVLSAVEGLEEVNSSFEKWVLPIAIAILVMLFLVQKRGTGAVGKIFGPVMMVWFSVLAVLGIRWIAESPAVLQAVNPIWAVRFFEHETHNAFLALGSIFLVVTGGEALYADMGHFGRKPIAVGWYSLVMPALMLNYFGQGAFLLANPEDVDKRFFFLMGPESLKLPLVILATMATIIASQALISGVFSLTQQAVQLDYLPRIRIDHTSHQHSGQIYVPLVNWALMVACVGIVLGFRSSTSLAAAYGIAVTMTMAITTLIFFRVLTDRWNWGRWKAFLVCVPMLVVELGFLGANIPKIPHGGWFALTVAAVLMVQMATWRRGRQLVAARIKRGERPIADVLDEHTEVKRVQGTGVFLFKDLGKAPPALMNNLRHNKVLHRTTLIVSVETSDEPRVDPAQRAEVTKVEPGVFQVLISYGFMEDPDVPAALAELDVRGLDFDPDDVTYFIGRESIVAGKAPGMNPVAEHLFVWLNRGADSAVRFFNLPDEQVFEVGSRVEI
ncbi:MAG: potassium transporter Kup [Acidimicrobiaceae bacterium]|nr:potassium transporter Kup [Ilumatobacter sp.]MCB9380451.1 potassium transporter Kup [Acidimicrobiaceae bacterium]MCO5330873.1 potassium transporter Kup [Ilumatobacteraceae bacterium]